MEAALDIFADIYRPMHTAHKNGKAVRETFVHGTTHYDRMISLDEYDSQKNELLFGHASELQYATTSLSTTFSLLAKSVKENPCN